MPQQNYWDQFEQDKKSDTPDDFFNQFETEKEPPKKPVDNEHPLAKLGKFATTPLTNLPSETMNSMGAGKLPPSKGKMLLEGLGGLLDDSTSPLSLATMGMAKFAGPLIKPLTRGVGSMVEPIGRLMRKHAPITGMPVVSPLAGRNLIKLERATGKGIEKLGQGMKNVGKAKETPLDIPLQKGDDLLKSIKVIRKPENETLSPVAKELLGKKKFKVNRDGTFTDLNTNEIVNSKGESIIEINGKPIDRNSSFFKKNRQ